MFTYYVLYRDDRRTTAVGLFVTEDSQAHAMLWDHRAKAWAYDPALVVRVLDDYRNYDRYKTVDRETAERVAPQITGGESLPDEETIAWIFQWEGNPPQSEETA
jgi:hypothetical protein